MYKCTFQFLLFKAIVVFFISVLSEKWSLRPPQPVVIGVRLYLPPFQSFAVWKLVIYTYKKIVQCTYLFHFSSLNIILFTSFYDDKPITT